MKTSWKKIKKKHTHYINIEDSKIVVGSYIKDGHSDNAGSATFREFLDGQYNHQIKDIFGEEVLEEVISAVRDHFI